MSYDNLLLPNSYNHDKEYSNLKIYLPAQSYLSIIKVKEILANFLDLKFFETKYKLANTDSTDIKGAMKKLEDRDFNHEILEVKMDLSEAEEDLKNQKADCEAYKSGLINYATEIRSIEEKITQQSRADRHDYLCHEAGNARQDWFYTSLLFVALFRSR